MSILNRLKKRRKHLAKFARRWPTNAYRIYDRDMPEYPWTIDLYADHVYLQRLKGERSQGQLGEVLEAVIETLGTPEEHIHYKERMRQNGRGKQYEKQDLDPVHVEVFEADLKFNVELETHIDCGLFLDHRNLRRMVGDEVLRRVEHGHDVRVLNLFCYTGAFSVWAASRGASKVVSVDLSNTYLKWAQENMTLNGLSNPAHEFVRSDVMRWISRHGEQYDVIVLDPPSFSQSKKMEGTLEVQRDHPYLINQCLRKLKRGGILYFSTNYRSFKLNADKLTSTGEEISKLTVPQDFRTGIHRTFVFK